MLKIGILSLVSVIATSSAVMAEKKDTMADCGKFADAWQAAYNSKNSQALAGMYDADKGLYSNAFWTAGGRDALAKAFAQDFAMGARMTSIKCNVSWSDSGIGVSEGTYVATAPGPNGVAMTMNGHWMSTVETKDGKYFLLTHTSNFQLPPPPAKM